MKKGYLQIFVLVCLLFALAACQPALPQTPTPTSTAFPPAPTSTSLPTPTETEMPTNTPTPTDEPTPTHLPEPLVLSVPVGEPQAIDGVIAPGEWDSAVVSSFQDGSEVFLMHKDGYLYLAVRAKTTGLIAGNIYLAVGDQISIMHTSAALGTARYQREGETWQLTQGFVWRCRQTSYSDAALAEREAFLADEGWVSINGYMGTSNELEYKITIPEGEFRLAANYIGGASGDIKIPWPAYLTDGTTTPTPDGPLQQMHFVPDVWAIIELQD